MEVTVGQLTDYLEKMRTEKSEYGVGLVSRVMQDVMEQREEILRAFVAKYGCEPESAVQITQSAPDGMRWFVRARTDEEMATDKVMFGQQPDLLPCSHCGGTPQYHECADYITISCSCGMQTAKEYGVDRDARKLKVMQCWNRR